ncbi:MAG: hypothetical protein M1823_001133 [Watsoniomyces obsoletus]|nr:MAG: hypothetical protein M1823_001133 [Watsoniomyces obsoletus]
MALSRAFTSKRNRSDNQLNTPQRSASARHQGKPVLRSQISAPVQLLSTTNMLSFNAPDIHHASSPSSVGSHDDSDAGQMLLSSPATSVGLSSIDSRPASPDAKHLSTHFTLGPIDAAVVSRTDSVSSSEGPAVPSRAPSHTKATHRALARQRSQQRLSPPSRAMPPARIDIEPAAHPFGRELEQVDEVAEEFGVRGSVLQEEERWLREQGLRKFSAQDYIAEIEALFGGVFEDRLPPAGSSWI